MARTKTTEYEPELMTPEGQRPFYLSSDGCGAMIAWDLCHVLSGGCGQPLLECKCKGGPREPYYITRWRVEAEGGEWKPATRSTTTVGTPVGSARKPSAAPAPTSMSMSSFIDADVIAKVKAEKESRDQDQ